MRKFTFRLIPFLAVFLCLTGSFSMAKESKRMAILPFIMNADRDLSFLQDGIVDMLASRLAWKGELEVIEKGLVKAEVASQKGALNRDAAFEIGKRLQADYVILGSLTVFGESVSVDAKILDVARSEELITAFSQTKGMDAVIPTVNQFAEDINEKVMGRPMAARAQAPSQEGAAPAGPGGLISSGGRDFEGKAVSHTQAVKQEIVAMDAGDVDGDGKVDLVFVTPDTVHVYKWVEKGFASFKNFKEKRPTHVVYVSVADLDRNGKAEIYVSSIGSADVRSYVLEWDGNGLKPIAEGVPWFLRVLEMPGRGKVLIGQKRETGGSFMGPVVFLTRQGNRFQAGEPVPLHPEGNIFNFALVDFHGTGKVDTVLLDSLDHLRLYDSGSQEVWRSDEPFGGTYTFIPKDRDDQAKDHIFISVPILAADVDEDGQREVMVSKNISSIGRLLVRIRTYSSGNLHFMVRDQIGLSSKWSTKKLGGAMVGYVIADVDHDNLPELVVGTVVTEDRLYGDPRSRIIIYDLK